MTRGWRFALTALALGAFLFLGACRPAEEAKPVAEKEPYKVGLSGAVTGPAAAYYMHGVEAFRLYFAAVNAEGGINGHPVELIIEDSRGLPPKAAEHAKKFSELDKVLLMVNVAPSSAQAAMLPIAEKDKVPYLLYYSGCIKEAYRKPLARYSFCVFNAPEWDADFMLTMGQEIGPKPLKVAVAVFDAPASRYYADYVAKLAQERGIEVVTTQVLPLILADATPFAAEIMRAGANWVLGWMPPTSHQMPVFDALTRLGWKGTWIGVTEPEVLRAKADNLLGIAFTAWSVDNLPIHQEIASLKAKYGSPANLPELSLAWPGPMVVHEALKRCGWPCDREKLRGVLENLEVDTKGLWGGGVPIKLSPDSHYPLIMRYRAYRWDSAQGKVVPVGDWREIKPKLE